MNCFASRKLLLAAPRNRTPEQQAHIAECRECQQLAASVADLDQRIDEAARVPVPEALAHRIMRSRHPRPVGRYIAAASIAVITAALTMALPSLQEAAGFGSPLEAVGPHHPAVTAIGFVIDEQPRLLDAGLVSDQAILESGLKRLRLSMQSKDVTVRHVGKCHMPETDCTHLVLDTPDGQVSVLFLPDYPVESRVLVADRKMTALVTPAGAGGYIVVAGSPKVAKRTGRLFRRG
jgi:Protein of unknown function (DUF3379)